ncbi:MULTISPECIES: LysR family transcriptional regulator [Bradyrhizobium]|uniref:LysR family transcriptional regulator n=3 Tax=Bradyrhizobium TaxID=374 RepID=A0A410VIJ4_9BRAD|nr:MULTISPECIES: LysR family transcriptional regulator [Bradyrhizobium]MCG2628174.1 LysR family transcriptional regulator [Bradyrhizobium zhengyangense]MCG2643293.1 LysR family transcriptional regulator [Bradyrhizobium zhengyangense]MCG2670393.1 LysR family transcriptional regulator [Bradyrhizobium zhengyangense]MDN4985872.1 LysR family transcriptional regulator [Bradyrhizobium sp. WYCCWR 13022]MDN5002749.1 LysR family transcriptional regulator [Bradyrhizobium sp. WYCCWR 12677]
MDLQQLRCFVATAEELHFGRAAQRMNMLPSALGRFVRLLEEDLGTRLLTRTTRNVALTDDGVVLLKDARALLTQADALAVRFRTRSRKGATIIRVGAIDSAAAGLIPKLLKDFRKRRPDATIQLVEDKTIRLLPRLLTGRLDLAFVRPPKDANKRLEFLFLFFETAVVALPHHHRLASRKMVKVADLKNEPLIVPERRSRPHSHDLTMKLFAEAGLDARIAQIAEEKQTIVNLVSAGLGIAIVPSWTSRLASRGVRYVRLVASDMNKLPLAAAWSRGTRDPIRDDILKMLRADLAAYAKEA